MSRSNTSFGFLGHQCGEAGLRPLYRQHARGARCQRRHDIGIGWLTYKFTPHLRMNIGGRLTHEKKDGERSEIEQLEGPR